MYQVAVARRQRRDLSVFESNKIYSPTIFQSKLRTNKVESSQKYKNSQPNSKFTGSYAKSVIRRLLNCGSVYSGNIKKKKENKMLPFPVVHRNKSLCQYKKLLPWNRTFLLFDISLSSSVAYERYHAAKTPLLETRKCFF